MGFVFSVEKYVYVGKFEWFIGETVGDLHVKLPLGRWRGVEGKSFDISQNVPNFGPLAGRLHHVDVVVPGDEGVVAEDSHQRRLQDKVGQAGLLTCVVERVEGKQKLSFLLRRHEGLEEIHKFHLLLGLREVVEVVVPGSLVKCCDTLNQITINSNPCNGSLAVKYIQNTTFSRSMGPHIITWHPQLFYIGG